MRCFAYSRYDVVGVWPGSAQDLGEESALAGNDSLPVNKDFELSPPTPLKFNGRIKGITDGGSETRCLGGRRASRLSVDDSDIHSPEYSTLRSL